MSHNLRHYLNTVPGALTLRVLVLRLSNFRKLTAKNTTQLGNNL